MSLLAASGRMRVLIVEDEPLMAEAIRDGSRLEAIAADIAGDSGPRHPRTSDDEVARHIVASGAGMLEVLIAADGCVFSAEELLKQAWDENADPFTNAVRITVSALRERPGEPSIIATVPGVGYRINSQSDKEPEGDAHT